MNLRWFTLLFLTSCVCELPIRSLHAITIQVPNAPTRAERGRGCTIQQAGFIPAKPIEEMRDFAWYVRAYEATPKIRMPGKCSSTFVSSDGHLLTAAHCLKSCLVKTGVFEEKNVLPASNKGSGVAFVADNEKLKSASCFIDLEGRDGVHAQVISVSSCIFKDPGDLFRLTQGEKPSSPECENPEDYVLLKVIDKKNRPFTCLPVGHGETPKDENLFGFGYPGKTERPYPLAWNSDGKSKYLSIGQRNDTGEYSVGDPVHGPFNKRASLPSLPSNYRYLTMDTEAGNSGMGVFTPTHGIVALNVMGFDGSAKVERHGAAIAIDVARIRESVRRQVSEDDYNMAFNCPVGN